MDESAILEERMKNAWLGDGDRSMEIELEQWIKKKYG